MALQKGSKIAHCKCTARVFGLPGTTVKCKKCGSKVKVK